MIHRIRFRSIAIAPLRRLMSMCYRLDSTHPDRLFYREGFHDRLIGQMHNVKLIEVYKLIDLVITL
jgi:hypothetical protein